MDPASEESVIIDKNEGTSGESLKAAMLTELVRPGLVRTKCDCGSGEE